MHWSSCSAVGVLVCAELHRWLTLSQCHFPDNSLEWTFQSGSSCCCMLF